jgi:hypothetical protein
MSTNDKAINDYIQLIKKNLQENIKDALKGIPVSVTAGKRNIYVDYQGKLICGMEIGDDIYKIYNASDKWSDRTSYSCEQSEDGKWFYFVNTIDECISQIRNLILFEAKNCLIREAQDSYSYDSQLKKTGLDLKKNWEGDPRNRFEVLLKPLIQDTDYFFKINVTDTSVKILELHKKGISHRIMGISGKRNMTINIFFNPDFYSALRKSVNLPENQKLYRSQPHMNITLEKLWDVMCATTGKTEYMLE